MSKFVTCLDQLSKEAEEDSGKKYLNALKHLGAGLAGYGLGTAAGRGAGHLLGKLDKTGPVPGARVARNVGPYVGAAAGLAYSLWKQLEQEKIQRELQGTNSGVQQGLPQ